MLLKKIESPLHYIKKYWVYVTWYIYSNQNNNLKLIYIKNSFKNIHIFKIWFLLTYFLITIIKMFLIYIRKIQYNAQFQTPT